jgi:cytochrome P450
MTKLVSELDMPKTQSNILPSEFTKYQQVENNLNIAKNSWIASFGFGYTIYHQDDIRSMLSDKRWHNALAFYSGVNSPDNTEEDEYYRKRRSNILINMEGNDHFRLKSLVAPSFQLKNIVYIKPFINWVTNIAIDRILEDNEIFGDKEFDIQKKLFNNLPVYILCQLIGLPIKDIEIFNAWTEAAFDSFSLRTREEIKEIRRQQEIIDEYILNLIDERRKEPKDDLITKLIKAEESGDILSNEEIVMLLQVIITSGIDTTRNQLGLCLSYFERNPDKWKEAIKSKDSMNQFLEEAMAFDGVIRNIGRFASEDIVYRDILFPKGTLIVPGITVSNLNEPERQPLTFGIGIHHCLGTALARLEIQEIFSILSRRIPNFKIKSIEHRETTHAIWGIKSLVVEI